MSTLSRCVLHFMRSSAASVILCVLVPSLYPDAGLSAQPIGEDIRVLDHVPHGLLADSIRIGDAAVVGSTIVAVWGGLISLPTGGTASALMVGSERGAGRYLTGTAARPRGRVAALAADNRILIIWNDGRTDAEGIYAVAVDSTGREVWTERRLIDSAEMIARPLLFTTADRHTLLVSVRRDSADVTEMLVFDRTGAIVAEPLQIRTGRLVVEESFPTRTGGMFVRVAGGNSVILMPDGLPYPEEIPDGRFDRAFVLDGPVSLLTTLPGGHFVRFDSLHDDAPEWSIDSIPGEALGRDSLGWFVAGFWGDFLRTPDMVRWVIRRDYVDTVQKRYLTSLFDTTLGPGYYPSANNVSIHSTESGVKVLGDGWIRLNWHGTVSYNPTGPIEYLEASGGDTRDYFWYSDGGLTQGRSVSSTFWYTSDSSGLNVRIRAVGEDRSVRFASATPPSVDSSATDYPVVMADGHGIAIGGMLGGDRLFSVHVPNGLPDGARPLPIHSSPGIDTALYLARWNCAGFVNEIRSERKSGDPPVALYQTDVEYYLWKPDSSGWYRSKSGAIRMQSSTGNRQAYPLRVTFDPNRQECMWVCSFTTASAPQFAYSRFGSELRVSDLSDDSSRILYSSKFALPPGDIVPADSVHVLHLGSDRYFRLYGPEATWLEDGSRPPLFRLGVPDRFGEVQLQRLYGDRFLAAGIDREHDSLLLVVQSLDGDTIATHGRSIESDTRMPFILQSPRDSMIVLLFGSLTGPIAHLLGPELQAPDTSSPSFPDVISLSSRQIPARNIVGSLVQDTLYVAWTDDRSGRPQVYMNAAQLPMVRSWMIHEKNEESEENEENEEKEENEGNEQNPGVDTTRPGVELVVDGLTPAERIERFGFAIVRIMPNPVFDDATLVIGSDSARTLKLSQYDVSARLLGSQIIDVASGEQAYAVPDVSSIRGVYYIVVSTPEHRETISFLYIPD